MSDSSCAANCLPATRFNIKADEIAETLIFRPEVPFQPAAGTPIRHHARTTWCSDGSDCSASPSSREFRLQARLHPETGTTNRPRKRFLTQAPHPRRIGGVRLTRKFTHQES